MPKNVILIGDSIRMGYQPVVTELLSGSATVWGPSDNCFTTRHTLERLDEWVIQRRPVVVHWNNGLHDLAKDPPQRDQSRVSLDEYVTNLRKMLKRMRDAGAVVIWATITPVNQDNHQRNKPFVRLEADVSFYNSAALALMREEKVPVDDLHDVITQAGRDELLLEDGVHYTPEGYRLLGQAVAAAIRPWL
ncbi:MAG: GDSL-type esterase/lipase family protein [Phycisphaeraceae bacterium]